MAGHCTRSSESTRSTTPSTACRASCGTCRSFSTSRALDWLGREYTPFLMRPAVRYVSRFPMAPELRDIEPLLDEYELLKRPLGFYTSPEETPEIGVLGEAITRCNTYAEIRVRVA